MTLNRREQQNNRHSEKETLHSTNLQSTGQVIRIEFVNLQNTIFLRSFT